MEKLTKWERRRPVVIKLSSANGWHKNIKIPRPVWFQIEAAAKFEGMSVEDWILKAIKSMVYGSDPAG